MVNAIIIRIASISEKKIHSALRQCVSVVHFSLTRLFSFMPLKGPHLFNINP